MSGLVYMIYLAVTIYAWLIVARAVMSWMSPRPGTVVYRVNAVLVDVTEPYLSPFRRAHPGGAPRRAGVDFSSVVALIVLFVGAPAARAAVGPRRAGRPCARERRAERRSPWALPSCSPVRRVAGRGGLPRAAASARRRRRAVPLDRRLGGHALGRAAARAARRCPVRGRRRPTPAPGSPR